MTVALPSDSEGLAPLYREAGAAVIRANLDFPMGRPWRIPRTLQLCSDVVERVQPDLIHTHNVGTTFVVRLALGKSSPIPRVFGVTGTMHLEHDLVAWLDLLLAGPRDSWIATCQWTRRKYLELGVPADRVFVAYLGTDLRITRSSAPGFCAGRWASAPLCL